MDPNLEMVLAAVKQLCVLTTKEESAKKKEFADIAGEGNVKIKIEPDYKKFEEERYNQILPNPYQKAMRDRIVESRLNQMLKKDRNNDGWLSLTEFIQMTAMWDKLDQTIIDENDYDKEFTEEELKKWMKKKCNIPDDKLDLCAKAVMKATYEGKETIDPYEFTGSLFNKAFPVE